MLKEVTDISIQGWERRLSEAVRTTEAQVKECNRQMSKDDKRY